MASVTVSGKSYGGDGRIDDIIIGLGMNPDAFIYIMEGVPVPSDTVVSGDEKVDAIRVASGG